MSYGPYDMVSKIYNICTNISYKIVIHFIEFHTVYDI